MKSFEDIIDNIDRLVTKGVMTESQGNIIADSFYDRYMTEANAFNKAVDIYKKKGVDKHQRYRLTKKLDIHDAECEDYAPTSDDIKERFVHTQHRYPIPGPERAINEEYIHNKTNWMKKHGDTGVSPEEKYKAGRYLKRQNLTKESSLDDIESLIRSHNIKQLDGFVKDSQDQINKFKSKFGNNPELVNRMITQQTNFINSMKKNFGLDDYKFSFK